MTLCIVSKVRIRDQIQWNLESVSYIGKQGKAFHNTVFVVVYIYYSITFFAQRLRARKL